MLGKSIYHGLLVYYLKEKSRLIEEKTGIVFIYDEDIEEVMKWSSSKIKQFFDNNDMYVRNPKYADHISDMRSCPWCRFHIGYIYNDYNCKWCGYGKRHGKCGSRLKVTTYGEVLKILQEKNIVDNGICEDKDLKNLCNRVKEFYSKISVKGFSYEDLCKLIFNN
jgi:hypothetical protein